MEFQGKTPFGSLQTDGIAQTGSQPRNVLPGTAIADENSEGHTRFGKEQLAGFDYGMRAFLGTTIYYFHRSLPSLQG
jgi:hypothetical protein